MHDEQALVRQALDAGASGYLTKRCAPDVLVEAVRKVLAGQPFIEQPLAVELACQRASSSANQGRLADMTPREMEVFIMLARGISTREIAQRLCISSKTVSNHMALLKNKLEVSSQAELVIMYSVCASAARPCPTTWRCSRTSSRSAPRPSW